MCCMQCAFFCDMCVAVLWSVLCSVEFSIQCAVPEQCEVLSTMSNVKC